MNKIVVLLIGLAVSGMMNAQEQKSKSFPDWYYGGGRQQPRNPGLLIAKPPVSPKPQPTQPVTSSVPKERVDITSKWESPDQRYQQQREAGVTYSPSHWEQWTQTWRKRGPSPQVSGDPSASWYLSPEQRDAYRNRQADVTYTPSLYERARAWWQGSSLPSTELRTGRLQELGPRPAREYSSIEQIELERAYQPMGPVQSFGVQQKRLKERQPAYEQLREERLKAYGELPDTRGFIHRTTGRPASSYVPTFGYGSVATEKPATVSVTPQPEVQQPADDRGWFHRWTGSPASTFFGYGTAPTEEEKKRMMTPEQFEEWRKSTPSMTVEEWSKTVRE